LIICNLPFNIIYDENNLPKLPISAMYGKNFKPKNLADITMLGKLFAAQIPARNHKFDSGSKSSILGTDVLRI